MCDYSGKLIAWLDHELPAEETAEVERHLEACSQCRSDVGAYKRVSNEFDAYCDETIALSERCGTHRWVAVTSAVGAAAVLVALFLALPRTHVESPAVHPPQSAAVTSPDVATNVMSAAASPSHSVHQRHAVAPARMQKENSASAQNQNAYFQPDEPMVQIAIPAEEMFPPGAVPEGMHFVADLTIAADGSAERLRLRPRLAGFERSTTQP
jgi:anti-sigma factor RsiW